MVRLKLKNTNNWQTHHKSSNNHSNSKFQSFENEQIPKMSVCRWVERKQGALHNFCKYATRLSHVKIFMNTIHHNVHKSQEIVMQPNLGFSMKVVYLNITYRTVFESWASLYAIKFAENKSRHQSLENTSTAYHFLLCCSKHDKM